MIEALYMDTEVTNFENVAKYFSHAIFESMKLVIPEKLVDWQKSSLENTPIVWMDFEAPYTKKFGRTSFDLLTSNPERIELNKIAFKELFNPQKILLSLFLYSNL